MKKRIYLTDDAESDLVDLYEHIQTHDSPANADRVLDQIVKTINTLQEFPERGSIPRELQSIGVREFRELFYKPYRIIYRVVDKSVYIFMISDGRRDMQTLLEQRLLRG